MSTFNEPLELLQMAIDSILAQTENNFEFIIVNDNPSNEETILYLNHVRKKDKRVKIVPNEKNIGLAASLNKAVNLAKYDVIARMDADDIALENRLEKELTEINKGFDFVFSRYIVIDENGNFVKKSKGYTSDEESLTKSIDIKNCVCHPTVMYKKQLFRTVGGYSILPVVEDYDLWKKFIDKNIRIKGINDVLLKYRVRSSSMTTSNYFKSYVAWRFIKKKYSKQSFIKKYDNFDKYYSKRIGRNKRNEIKYNNNIQEYYHIRDNWKNVGSSKYIKLLKLLISNYRIGILLFDSYRANYYRS